MEISQRAYVLEYGHLAHQGEAKRLLSDENIKAAYLGI